MRVVEQASETEEGNDGRELVEEEKRGDVSEGRREKGFGVALEESGKAVVEGGKAGGLGFSWVGD